MIWLSTSDTPGAAQAARSAWSISAQERTLPLIITLPPRVSIVIRRESSKALRRNALSIWSFTSCAFTGIGFIGAIAILLLSPRTHIRLRTVSPAASFWYHQPTSPLRVIQPFSTTTSMRSIMWVNQTFHWRVFAAAWAISSSERSKELGNLTLSSSATALTPKTRATARWAARSAEPPVRVENAWPAIISREAFQLVQRKMASRRPQVVHPRTVPSFYLLSGLLF
jgi:hypothetical protein